jgi:hypothetical protein
MFRETFRLYHVPVFRDTNEMKRLRNGKITKQ